MRKQRAFENIEEYKNIVANKETGVADNKFCIVSDRIKRLQKKRRR